MEIERTIHRYVPVLFSDGFRPACSCGWVSAISCETSGAAERATRTHLFLSGACELCGGGPVVIVWADIELSWCSACARSLAEGALV